MNQKTCVERTKELSGQKTLDAAYAAIEEAFTVDASAEMPLFLAVQVDRTTLKMNISIQGITMNDPQEAEKTAVLRQALIQVANGMGERIQALEKDIMREQIRQELQGE